MISAYEVNEKDWKLFRNKIAGWQDAYIDKLNKEYINLLSSDEKPSIKFWALEKRIRNDKNDAGVVVEMKRSKLIDNIAALLDESAIPMDDLEEFSDEFKERVRFLQDKKLCWYWSCTRIEVYLAEA